MEHDTQDMHANGTWYLKIPVTLAHANGLKKKRRTKFIIEYDPYYDENEFKVRKVVK